MTKPLLSTFALGVALAALPGCPLLTVEAEVPEICLSYPNLTVETAVGATSTTQRFTFDDLSAVQDLLDDDASLTFVRAEVRATSGIESFSFVDAVHVVASSGAPGSTLPALTIYDCDGDCVPEGSRLAIPASTTGDAVALLRTGSVAIDLDFQGTIPAASWTIAVDVCMAAKAGYTVSP